MPLAAGTRLGPYEVLGLIGAGGMGEVYKARDTRLDRTVAIKILPNELARDPDRTARFQREAQAVAGLNHPHICTLHDIGTENGTTYLVMEHLVGETLADRLTRGQLPLAQVLALGAQIADALAAAHRAGIVHRDLKPANVMLVGDGRTGSGTAGTVKLLDFGLAKLTAHGEAPAATMDVAATETATLTGRGTIVGTLPYMAPEQVQGLPADARTDIWALGAILYEMATGVRAFDAGSAPSLIAAILAQEPPSLSTRVPLTPPALERVVRRCLAKRPDERWASAHDVEDELRWITHETSTRGTALAGRIRPRRWASVAAILVSVLALVAAAVWLGRVGIRTSTTAGSVGVLGGPPSIVVMPFSDLSPSNDQEYFTQGLVEELVSSLARLPDLRVATYKGTVKDRYEVARQLHVSTVLEGSVRKAGEHVRIAVRLMKASDSFSLWSDTYDRTLNDIFAVQDDIARSVASALQVKLLSEPRPTRTGNPEAYNRILEAQYLRKKGGTEAYDKALALLQQAAALDPTNGRVFAELSRLHFARASDSPAGDAEFGESWKAANRAVELDPGLADAHQALGWFDMTKNWNWTAADASFKRALALEPRNVRALRSAAALAGTFGHFDEAIALGQRAAELEPTNADIYYNLAFLQRKAGQFDTALINQRRALELDPKMTQAHFQIGVIYLLKGEVDDAMREFALETDQESRARGLAMAYYSAGHREKSDKYLQDVIARGSARDTAQVFAWRNEKDRAFEWLDRAYVLRDWGLSELNGDPLFRNLEGDPRWTAFLAVKMRLPR